MTPVLVATGLAALAAAALGKGSVVEPVRLGARLLLVQRRTTPAPDALLRWAAAGALPVLAVLAAAVVPVLPGERTYLSTSADLVWFNAVEALLWLVWWCAGWGPNSLHPLVAAYRSFAQGLAYELPLMFALITVGVGARSLRVEDVVAVQQDGLWFVLSMPVAAAVFLASSAAFAAWGPFAAPLAPDVAGGVAVEAAGVERLLLHGGRAAFLGVASVMAAALFLGGGEGPLLPWWAWLAVKAALVLAVLVLAARRLPVLRPDRLMDVAWVVLVPATVVQALLVSVLVLDGRL